MYDLALLPERFRSKVHVSTEHFYHGTPCWEWMAGTRGGYGIYFEGQMVSAHRYAYHWLVGTVPILAGRMRHGVITLDHLCRNQRCVNPEHMEPVTLGVNILRGTSPQSVNAHKTHCVHGHEFTPENTISREAGRRRCRICENALRKRRYWRNPEPNRERALRRYNEHGRDRRRNQSASSDCHIASPT